MTTPGQAGGESQAIPPNCPKCGKPMPMIGLFAYQIEMLLIPALFCPWCHHLLHIEIKEPPRKAQPEADPEPPKSPLWKPS